MEHGNIIRSIFTAAAAMATFGAWAATETVGGYTWTYRINGGTAEIEGISPSPTGAVTIPSTLGGKPVTIIGNRAFEVCSGLTSVTIGNNVTSIAVRRQSRVPLLHGGGHVAVRVA